MTGYDLSDTKDREDRRKHLDLIAAVVGRMASSSAQAKGWSITLAGAAFGVAVIRDNWLLILLGIGGLVAFAKIDAHYLDVEKDFRDLHDAVIANTAAPLSMDTSNLGTRSKNDSYASWSIKWFYGPLILAGCLLLIYSMFHSGGDSPEVVKDVKVTVTVVPAHSTAPGTSTKSPTPPPSPAPTETHVTTTSATPPAPPPQSR